MSVQNHVIGGPNRIEIALELLSLYCVFFFCLVIINKFSYFECSKHKSDPELGISILISTTHVANQTLMGSNRMSTNMRLRVIKSRVPKSRVIEKLNTFNHGQI